MAQLYLASMAPRRARTLLLKAARLWPTQTNERTNEPPLTGASYHATPNSPFSTEFC